MEKARMRQARKTKDPATPQARKSKKGSAPQACKTGTTALARFAASGRCVPAVHPAGGAGLNMRSTTS
jgi:hypothetical protein